MPPTWLAYQRRPNIFRFAEHLNDFLKSSCLPAVRSATYAMGKHHIHYAHNIQIHGGIFLWCSCGATARTKLIKLSAPCPPPALALHLNWEAYNNGLPSEGFLVWPHKKLWLEDQTFIKHIQAQIDSIDKAYKLQFEETRYSESIPSESQPPTKRPRRDSPGDSSESGCD